MGSEQAEGVLVFIGFVREVAGATRPEIFVVGWPMAPDWCISPQAATSFQVWVQLLQLRVQGLRVIASQNHLHCFGFPLFIPYYALALGGSVLR